MWIWLNQNAGAIQAIFGGLVFIATAYYVWVSLGMLKEMKIIRIKEEEPNINLRLIKIDATKYNLEITNISNIEVFDLRFIEAPDLNYGPLKTSQIGFIKNGISYLGIGQILDHPFLCTLYNNDKIEDQEHVHYLVFKMEYYNKNAKYLNRKKFSKEIQINLNFISKTFYLKSTEELKLERLDKLNSHLEKIAESHQSL